MWDPPCKCETLSSNPGTPKKKKKKNGAESGGTDLHSQLLGRQRQKNQEFKASLSKVKETLSQNQPTK
jgi:hypothetical protein